MKKKLLLKKEVVSILDRTQMNRLTKAGETSGKIETGDTICDSGWSDCCNEPSLVGCNSMNCGSSQCVLTQKNCDTVGNGCVLISVDKCVIPYTEQDGCPIVAKTFDDDCKTERMCPLTATC